MDPNKPDQGGDQETSGQNPHLGTSPIRYGCREDRCHQFAILGLIDEEVIMKFKILEGKSKMDHVLLDLEIDGNFAEILDEPKPTLFNAGFIYLHPDSFWKNNLPAINIMIAENDIRRFEGFLHSQAIREIMIELMNSTDILAFNRKWRNKEFEEDLPPLPPLIDHRSLTQ